MRAWGGPPSPSPCCSQTYQTSATLCFATFPGAVRMSESHRRVQGSDWNPGDG